MTTAVFGSSLFLFCSFSLDYSMIQLISLPGNENTSSLIRIREEEGDGDGHQFDRYICSCLDCQSELLTWLMTCMKTLSYSWHDMLLSIEIFVSTQFSSRGQQAGTHRSRPRLWDRMVVCVPLLGLSVDLSVSPVERFLHLVHSEGTHGRASWGPFVP